MGIDLHQVGKNPPFALGQGIVQIVVTGGLVVLRRLLRLPLVIGDIAVPACDAFLSADTAQLEGKGFQIESTLFLRRMSTEE